jgi:uncharacterized membrane protein
VDKQLSVLCSGLELVTRTFSRKFNMFGVPRHCPLLSCLEYIISKYSRSGKFICFLAQVELFFSVRVRKKL